MKEPKPNSKKKVLIIAYYWPPAGGPGVQRWLNFVKYLPEFEIDPIVYCPSNPNYPIKDDSLLAQVPEKVKIIKQPINEPYRFANWFSKSDAKTISSGIIPKKEKQSLLQQLMLLIRGNFFIPDARKHWVKPSVSFLSQVIKEEKIDLIITTGPPHSLHLIGMQLKKEFGILWVTDFRDPWTTIGYHKKLKLRAAAKNKHLLLEREVLNECDHIVVTSFHTKKEFAQKTRKPISVITNGFNPYEGPVVEKSQFFSLAHIGSLLSERNPMALWAAISELIKENKQFAKAFRLELYGVVSQDILSTLEHFQLLDYVNQHGYVSHEKALMAQRESRLLLLVEIDSEDTRAIIPGKLFEYMASETPILAVGPKESDVETILYNSSAGNYFSYDQKDSIKTQLSIHFQKYLDGTLLGQTEHIEQYSRRVLTHRLAELIHQLQA